MSTFCRTTLNYVPSGGPGAGRRQAEIDIFDGRVAKLPGWQTCGFELVSHASAVAD